jgi:hypothetical protein
LLFHAFPTLLSLVTGWIQNPILSLERKDSEENACLLSGKQVSCADGTDLGMGFWQVKMDSPAYWQHPACHSAERG